MSDERNGPIAPAFGPFRLPPELERMASASGAELHRRD